MAKCKWQNAINKNEKHKVESKTREEEKELETMEQQELDSLVLI